MIDISRFKIPRFHAEINYLEFLTSQIFEFVAHRFHAELYYLTVLCIEEMSFLFFQGNLSGIFFLN